MPDFLAPFSMFTLFSILGAIGFALAVSNYRRTRRIEETLKKLERNLRHQKPTHSEQRPPAHHADFAPPPDAAATSRDIAREAMDSKPPAPVAPQKPPIHVAPPKTPAASPVAPLSLEQRIGTRWVVYVGGIAIALGGLLLVRFAFEHRFFGPGARIVSGLVLSALLLGAGERLRRDEAETRAASPTPAILTAAGTTTAFGVIYAAHALYGFIGPGFAFVALGLTAIATLFAALLHGPAIAGLGIIAAIGVPLFVDTPNPSPWPLAIYVAIVVSTSYALARFRQWAWLAVSATVGAAVWGCSLSGSGSRSPIFAAAAELHFGFHTAIAVFIYSLSRRPVSGNLTLHRRLANLAPSVFAVLAIFVLIGIFPAIAIDALWVMSAAAIIGFLAYGGATRPAFAPALLLAAGVANVELLEYWPLVSFLELRSPGYFLAFAVIGSLTISWLAGRALWRNADLPYKSVKILASAAALTPLATLWIANGSASEHRSLSTWPIQALSTLAALAVASGFLVFAQSLRQRNPQEQNDRFALGVMAAACLAAIALGLNFSLDGGSLTVALALSALGAAYVEHRLDIPALRKAVCAMGLLIALRLAWDPRIVGDDLGSTPILNWLLFGYGVPALSFGLASRLLGKRSQDRATQIAQTLAIVFAALLAFFEIRHAMSGGDVFRQGVSLPEIGLYAITSLGFSYALVKIDIPQKLPVLQIFSRIWAAVATTVIAFGALLAENPFFTETPVGGGPILNALLLGYALPAAAAAVLANTGTTPPSWLVRMTRLTALTLVMAYVTLETRLLFEGPFIGMGNRATSMEIYAYSAVWLVLGVALLAYGLLRQSFEARVASAAVILLAILKVFLYDLANLEGAARALSFIGLGAVLIGIGLAYQKIVFRAANGP